MLTVCFQCHDDNDDVDVDVAIGEISGNQNLKMAQNDDFDFLNGGSGKIFNKNLVRKLSNLDFQDLRCSLVLNRADSMIGRALADLGVIPIHDERFHQYQESMLQNFSS